MTSRRNKTNRRGRTQRHQGGAMSALSPQDIQCTGFASRQLFIIIIKSHYVCNANFTFICSLSIVELMFGVLGKYIAQQSTQSNLSCQSSPIISMFAL